MAKISIGFKFKGNKLDNSTYALGIRVREGSYYDKLFLIQMWGMPYYPTSVSYTDVG